MLRLIVIFMFVAGLAFTPVWLLDSMVMPQLFSLKAVYGNAEATAQQAVNAKSGN